MPQAAQVATHTRLTAAVAPLHKKTTGAQRKASRAVTVFGLGFYTKKLTFLIYVLSWVSIAFDQLLLVLLHSLGLAIRSFLASVSASFR